MSKPLPQFPSIKLEDIPPASTLLFYGGNKLTQFAGNTLYKHPYTPPAFHAAFYIGIPSPGIFLNVGAFKTLQDVTKAYRSTRRIDVITYNIPDEIRKLLCREAIMDTSRHKVGLTLPDYDGFKGYMGFGWRWLLRKIGVKAKAKENKRDFCSDNVADLFGTQGIKVSPVSSEETAPWTLLEWAIDHPLDCVNKTLFVGKDYAKKYGGEPL